MRAISIVICDTDSAFVQSLSWFLCGQMKNISVVAFTQMNSFLNSSGHYHLGLFGKEFLQVYEEQNPDLGIDDIYYLSSTLGEGFGSYNVFYKYQNMRCLLEIIAQKHLEEKMGCNESEKPKVYGIYSPIQHDLRVPFSLTFSHLLSQKKETLFLDLEPFSVLPGLIPNDRFDTDFMDIMYLLKSQKKDFDLKKYIFYFEDIAMLPVAKNPFDFAAADEDAWDLLIEKILKLRFQLVVLFDRLDSVSKCFYPIMDELILLGRPEDYYRYSQECCREYLNESDLEFSLHSVDLNMSATGLKEGSFGMKKIIEGNMAGFIQNEFKGTFASAGIK